MNCSESGATEHALLDCGIGTGTHGNHHAERDDYNFTPLVAKRLHDRRRGTKIEE
jgi:hypothetical protein